MFTAPWRAAIGPSCPDLAFRHARVANSLDPCARSVADYFRMAELRRESLALLASRARADDVPYLCSLADALDMAELDGCLAALRE